MRGDARSAGETDLARLLATLTPQLGAESYVFCTLTPDVWKRAGTTLAPLATFREAEGVSVILREDEAAQAGLGGEGPFRLITLTVYSSLQAVGLLAAVTGALAAAGISVNAVAAFYHDHLLVPAERAEEALAVLQTLSRGASSRGAS